MKDTSDATFKYRKVGIVIKVEKTLESMGLFHIEDYNYTIYWSGIKKFSYAHIVNHLRKVF